MTSWIITGGIACGKSSVSRLLSDLLLSGSPFFSADQAVRDLMGEADVLESLRSTLGPSAVLDQDDGPRANVEWLRSAAFADPVTRRLLEEILHPGVLAALETARKHRLNARANLFLAEVPLHYEIGATVSADLIIVVAASPVVQKRRLMERRGLDESIIEQMLRAQWPIEAKVERADVVIWNDGDRGALEAQVLTLARQHCQA